MPTVARRTSAAKKVPPPSQLAKVLQFRPRQEDPALVHYREGLRLYNEGSRAWNAVDFKTARVCLDAARWALSEAVELGTLHPAQLAHVFELLRHVESRRSSLDMVSPPPRPSCPVIPLPVPKRRPATSRPRRRKAGQ